MFAHPKSLSTLVPTSLLVCALLPVFWISSARAACGDVRLDGVDQCDDGGTVAGDGCSASCTVERNYACFSTNPYFDGDASGNFSSADDDLHGVRSEELSGTFWFDGKQEVAINFAEFDDGIDVTVNGAFVYNSGATTAGNATFEEGALQQSWIENDQGLPRLAIVISETELHFFGTLSPDDTELIELTPPSDTLLASFALGDGQNEVLWVVDNDGGGPTSSLSFASGAGSICQFSCGDASVDPSELCDDGNDQDTDACSNDCLIGTGFEGCSVDDDCYDSSAVCDTGACLLPRAEGPCSASAECQAGLNCEAQICQLAILVDESGCGEAAAFCLTADAQCSDNRCLLPEPVGCQVDDDCPGEQRCQAPQCYECIEDADCDGVCEAHTCVQCREDDDCEDAVCHQNSCVPCVVDEDCGNSRVCSQQTCVQCVRDRDCDSSGVCSEQQCVECTKDAHCDGACLEQQCVECTKDAHCDGACFGQQCVECTNDSHCDGACFEQQCVECTNDSHCDGACFEQQCVECTKDAHCDDQDVCDDHTCVQCARDNDCDDEEVCSDQRCVQCRVDADCSSDLLCRSELCVEPPQSPEASPPALKGSGLTCSIDRPGSAPQRWGLLFLLACGALARTARSRFRRAVPAGDD